MYDGKRSTAERILYGALDKIKSKNEDPVKIFNSAISPAAITCTPVAAPGTIAVTHLHPLPGIRFRLLCIFVHLFT